MSKKNKGNKNNTSQSDTTAFSKEDWFGTGKRSKKRGKKKTKTNKVSYSTPVESTIEN